MNIYSIIINPERPQQIEFHNLTRKTLKKYKENMGFKKDVVFPKSGKNFYGFDKHFNPVTIIKYKGVK